MRKIKEIPVVKLGIPDDTTEEMLKYKKMNNSIGAISDVIFSIEEIVQEGFSLENIYHSKNKKIKKS